MNNFGLVVVEIEMERWEGMEMRGCQNSQGRFSLPIFWQRKTGKLIWLN